MALYLTFDDGPSGYTPEILEILARHEIPATFFVVGKCIAGCEDILSAVFAAGHSIGNHSYSHQKEAVLDYKALEEDMDRCTQAIGEVLPLWRPRLCRPPYGDLSFDFLSYAIKHGLRVVLWTKDARDYSAPSVDLIHSRLAAVQSEDVILFHDKFPVTCKALSDLILRWKDSGCEFLKF